MDRSKWIENRLFNLSHDLNAISVIMFFPIFFLMIVVLIKKEVILLIYPGPWIIFMVGFWYWRYKYQSKRIKLTSNPKWRKYVKYDTLLIMIIGSLIIATFITYIIRPTPFIFGTGLIAGIIFYTIVLGIESF